MKKQLLIIDGHNLLFKMYYGIPNSIKKNNVEIKGVIGFIGAILKLYKIFKPYNIIVIFDSESSIKENKKIDTSYKSNRTTYTKIEENPFTQLEMIKHCLQYLKIYNYESQDFEADDYIASICKHYQKYYSIIIVSTDKDFLQLINENISVYKYYGKKSILYNKKEMYSKYNITPEQFPLYLALIGDKTDNITGIKGVGPKTAIKLIKSNDTVFFEKHKNIIKKNITLINLNRNININKIIIKNLKLENINTKDVIDVVLK